MGTMVEPESGYEPIRPAGGSLAEASLFRETWRFISNEKAGVDLGADDMDLHAEYARRVATIRAFEPELKAALLDPLRQIPGVLDVRWRIKPWDATLARLMGRIGRHDSYDLAGIADLLGVQVVVADTGASDSARRLIADKFDVEVHQITHGHLPGIELHQWHLAATPKATGTNPDPPERFEIQVVSSTVQALTDAEHALRYRRGSFGVATTGLDTIAYVRPFDERQPPPAKLLDDALEGAARLDGIIDRFEQMILAVDVHEKRDIHSFLNEHRFLLHPGPDTIVSEPAIGLGTQYRLDFLIREATGDYILVELENPRRALFTAGGNPTAHVTHAVQQVEDWQEWIEQNVQTVQRKYPDMLAPSGLVVIGRSVSLSAADKQKLARRNINMRGRLKIETYDEVVAKARAYVAGMRRNLGL